VDAVLVAEGEIAEEVFKSVNAPFGQEFGALRADSFEHLCIGQPFMQDARLSHQPLSL